MSVIPMLRQRFADADAVLRSVKRLERQQRSNPRSTPTGTRVVACLRAGVYVMLYNAVEASIRGTMESLRRQIQQEGITFAGAKDHWRLDCIQATFLEKMQNGTNHGNVLSDLGAMSNAPLQWQPDKLDRLPGSGNFGQSTALLLKRQMPLANWSAPSGTAGGTDLETIRVNRNNLAHGLEEYAVIGTSTTTLDMFAMIDRSRSFMESLLLAIEYYQASRQYIR